MLFNDISYIPVFVLCTSCIKWIPISGHPGPPLPGTLRSPKFGTMILRRPFIWTGTCFGSSLMWLLKNSEHQRTILHHFGSLALNRQFESLWSTNYIPIYTPIRLCALEQPLPHNEQSLARDSWKPNKLTLIILDTFYAMTTATKATPVKATESIQSHFGNLGIFSTSDVTHPTKDYVEEPPRKNIDLCNTMQCVRQTHIL